MFIVLVVIGIILVLIRIIHRIVVISPLWADVIITQSSVIDVSYLYALEIARSGLPVITAVAHRSAIKTDPWSFL